MSVVQEAADELILWPWWENRFKDNHTTYITPYVRPVDSAVTKAGARDCETDIETAMECWQWVWRNTDYKLSKEWKTPAQTIREARGDCEDFTFLISSMLCNAGVLTHEVVAGYLIDTKGNRQAHTWNNIDGTVIDATGEPAMTTRLRYEREFAFTVTLNE